MAKYLKDIVKESGGTLLLDIDSIGSPFMNDHNKELRHVSFKIKSTGKIIQEDIFAVKWKYGMRGVGQGDSVEAFINKEGYIDFKKIDATAEYSEFPSQSPQEQVKAERAATASVEKEDEKWSKIAASKIIHNFMLEGYKLGKAPDEAAKDAVAFYTAQVNAVNSLTILPE